MTKSPKIAMWNVLAEEQSIYHLTVEELYLYGLLNTLRNREQKIYTNIDLLQQISPVKFYSREKESKQRIRKCLLSLKDKGVIKFDNEKVNNKIALEIIPIDDLEDSDVGKGVKGFQSITYEQFRQFKNMFDFYVYFTVSRFNAKGGFRCNYNRWANILDCSEKQARTKINDLVKRNIIYKNVGDYIDENVNGREQKKQDNNVYKTVPFTNEEKTIQTKITEKKEKEQLNKVTQQEFLSNEDNNIQDDKETREHKWLEKGSNLTATDFYVYLTTKDEQLKKRAEGRIKAISKTEKGQYFVDKMVDEAKEMIKDKEKKQELDMLKNATNAIRLTDGTIVVVNENNIDNYNLNDVDSFFWANDNYLDRERTFTSLLPQELKNNKTTPINDPELKEYAWECYKELVINNVKIDYEKGNELQSKIFDKKGLVDYDPMEGLNTKTVYISTKNRNKEKKRKIKSNKIDMNEMEENLKKEEKQR